MGDLFSLEGVPERLPLEGAEVVFYRSFFSEDESRVFFASLVEDTPWRQEEIVIWGKKVRQPRLTAWYGDSSKSYSYSGLILNPLPWTEDLLKIRAKVEKACGFVFNSVLLNLYRSNEDSMGFHSDDEPELGLRPTIASVSFGAERDFVLKSKKNRNLTFKLSLGSGSLLVMGGDTQTNWKHGVPKSTRPRGARLNLTFRNILNRARSQSSG